MGKQPYIPFYIGDYLKDTRILPLAVRGAWVDLILFMWDAPVRGELIGTIQEIARLIGCDTSEAKFALDLLKQKNTASIDLLPSGEYKIVSRRMKKDAEISAIRSEVGKKGVEAKKKSNFAEPKAKAKQKQNTEYDNEYDNEDNNDNELSIWPTFQDFWDAYDKKQSRPKCEKKWKKIEQGAREKIMQHLEVYIPSTPDKQYRKNPETYLNNESWNDEIIIKLNGTTDKRTEHIRSLATNFAIEASRTD
jgi:uncharacterized protein YdaU (DUF1376 family)